MPRNGAGTYTLPAGNPVVAGDLIEASWANTTLADVGNELTNSLDRNGNGGMLAPFRLADGTLGAPGVAWLNEPSTGFYRAGSGEMWGVVSGTQILQYTVNGLLVPTGKTLTMTDGVANAIAYFNGSKALSASSGLTFDGTTLTATKFAGALNGTVGATTPSTGAFTTLSATGVGKINSSLTATGSGLDVGGGIGLNDAARYKSIYTYLSGVVQAYITNDSTSNYLEIGTLLSGGTLRFTSGAGVLAATLDSTGILKLEQDQHIRNGKGLALYEATNTTYYSLYNSSGTLTFSNGTGRMFLDASGNLTKLHSTGYISSQSDGYMVYGGGTTTSLGANIFCFGQSHATNANQIQFRNSGNTTQMTLDASGNLLVGTTTSTGRIAVQVATNGDPGIYFRNQSGTNVGQVQVNSSATAYVTSSDKDLKTDLGIATDTSVIDNTEIHDFAWKVDGSADRGVFAQDAYLVKPSAVFVGSNKVNEDGSKDRPWGVDYSKYVPDLIVYSKNLKSRVAQLEAEKASMDIRLTSLELRCA